MARTSQGHKNEEEQATDVNQRAGGDRLEGALDDVMLAQ
jgi:hypothetical protein